MKLGDFLRDRDCPVCGFGILGSGGDRKNYCVFDHEWDYEGAYNTGRKIIIRPATLKAETSTVIICPYCDQWNEQKSTECSNCGNKLL